MTIFRAIGLMSGTSRDGIDAAMIETDGKNRITPIDFLTVPYDDRVRENLRRLSGRRPEQAGDAAAAAARELTLAHARIVAELRRRVGRSAADIDIIGFHGHTLTHRPDEGWSWQLGDGQLLADHCRCPVVDDFRRRDLTHGGQGAPLAPLFHAALLASLAPDPRPAGVLNIGGIANLTLLRTAAPPLALDTGPGNALLDDWIRAHTGQAYDRDGEISMKGRVADGVVEGFLSTPWFSRKPPKSLDRTDLDPKIVDGLSLADGAATLCACTAAAVRRAVDDLPERPRVIHVCGGGRHNRAMMKELKRRLDPAAIDAIEAIGARSDAIEAQAFAWLAVRSRLDLPLSLPSTTGVSRPLSGGRHSTPRKGREPPGRATPPAVSGPKARP